MNHRHPSSFGRHPQASKPSGSIQCAHQVSATGLSFCQWAKLSPKKLPTPELKAERCASNASLVSKCRGKLGDAQHGCSRCRMQDSGCGQVSRNVIGQRLAGRFQKLLRLAILLSQVKAKKKLEKLAVCSESACDKTSFQERFLKFHRLAHLPAPGDSIMDCRCFMLIGRRLYHSLARSSSSTQMPASSPFTTDGQKCMTPVLWSTSIEQPLWLQNLKQLMASVSGLWPICAAPCPWRIS